MRPVLLIAVNFVREQRWPILVLLLWVLLLAFQGLVTELPREREDLLFIFKQVAVYVVVFSVFFGGSAIYNETQVATDFSRAGERCGASSISLRTGHWRDHGLWNLLFYSWDLQEAGRWASPGFRYATCGI